jgi:hypothetical protein
MELILKSKNIMKTSVKWICDVLINSATIFFAWKLLELLKLI